MTIKEFADKACISISQKLNTEIHVSEILKLNGIKYYSLTIYNPQHNTNPTLYMESFYKMYQATGDWNSTMTQIINAYRATEYPNIDMDWFYDFDQVKDKVFMRLINLEANKELLGTVPYIYYLDFAIVFYVIVKVNENKIGSILIRNEHLTTWKQTPEDLLRLALDNTPRLYPLTTQSIWQVLERATNDDKDAISSDANKFPMYIMTNTQGLFGATVMIYRDSLKDFAEKCKDDLLILPSSLHEIMVIPLKKICNDFNHFKNMVQDINQTKLSNDQFLSNNIYLYHRETDGIETIETDT